MALITGYFIYEYHAGIRHLLFEKFGWFPTEEQLELMQENEMTERWMQEQKKVEYCIHVRVPDEPERVLRYNKAFDNMEEISEDEFQKADF